MVRLKFSLHPLFIIFGIYFAITGKVFSFLVYTICAALHELGHYAQSEKLGYALNKIVLMPYGAIIKGDNLNIRYKDEILIALAGPLYNFVIATFFVALWWVFPNVYPYTDIIVTANFSLAVINLLPCYPLDGGRFLLATLSLFLRRNTAKKIVQGLGLVLALTMLALFVYSIFTTVNFTILFFSLFMIIGAFSRGEIEYVKIYQNLTYKKSRTPWQVKTYIVGGDCEVKSLYPLMNGEYYYQVIIDGDSKITLEGEVLYRLLCESSPYEKLNKAIKKES